MLSFTARGLFRIFISFASEKIHLSTLIIEMPASRGHTSLLKLSSFSR